MNKNTITKKLAAQDCTPEIFSKFNRYHDVKRCWRKENGKWILKDIAFIEQWDDDKKAEKMKNLSHCISQGGVAIGSFVDSYLIGYANISEGLFGSNNEYVNMDNLHVSYELRNKGIGKTLFREICEEARKMGAKKLYISSQSSEETQAFYKSVGCVEAVEINSKLFEEEPFDCHLEYLLYGTL